MFEDEVMRRFIIEEEQWSDLKAEIVSTILKDLVTLKCSAKHVL